MSRPEYLPKHVDENIVNQIHHRILKCILLVIYLYIFKCDLFIQMYFKANVLHFKIITVKTSCTIQCMACLKDQQIMNETDMKYYKIKYTKTIIFCTH